MDKRGQVTIFIFLAILIVGVILIISFNQEKISNYNSINNSQEEVSGIIVEEKICQNAEKGGLCNGLDLAYILDYQESCCSEHYLCC